MTPFGKGCVQTTKTIDIFGSVNQTTMTIDIFGSVNTSYEKEMKVKVTNKHNSKKWEWMAMDEGVFFGEFPRPPWP